MPLTAGTRLDPYEIAGMLGAGGMGDAVTKDGQRFLVNSLQQTSAMSLTVVVNWPATIPSR